MDKAGTELNIIKAMYHKHRDNIIFSEEKLFLFEQEQDKSQLFIFQFHLKNNWYTPLCRDIAWKFNLHIFWNDYHSGLS